MKVETWRHGNGRRAVPGIADPEFEAMFGMRLLDGARRQTAIITILVAIALLGGSLIKVDVFATATGRITPASYVKSIDAPRTGYVRRVLVDDGRLVTTGQPILEYDCRTEDAQRNAAKSQLENMEQQLNSQSRLARNIVPGLAGLGSAAGSGRPQREAELRWSLYQASEQAAREGLLRATAKIDAAKAKLAAARSDQLSREHALDQLKALSNGSFTERATLDEVAARLRLSTANVQIAEAELADAEQAARQSRSGILTAKLGTQSDVLRAVSEAQADVLKLHTDIAKLDAESSNCIVAAPATGQLFWLDALAAGSWVRSATPLSKVVPQNQPMIVEAVLQGQDVPFVHAGQRAIVKLTSLPFERYGTLEGKVRFVSPDSISSGTDKSAYRVQVVVTGMPEEARSVLPKLISGMDVEVNVVTDNRRLIGYFFDPIIVAVQQSFHER